MAWAESVICPFCGSQPWKQCVQPNGAPTKTHRARLMLAILGDKNARAAAVIDRIVEDNIARRGRAAATLAAERAAMAERDAKEAAAHASLEKHPSEDENEP